MASGVKACEHCMQYGILEPLVSITKDSEPDTLFAKTTVIKILCQNYCIHLLPECADILLRYLFTLIFNSNNDIVLCALKSMSYLNSDRTLDFLIPQHVYDRFLQLFNHLEKNIQVSAYFAFGNIINCCYRQMQPQMICDTVKAMEILMKYDDPSVQEKTLSFLLKSIEDNAYVNIPASVLPQCVKLLGAKSFKLQQLAASLLEKISGGTKEQIDAILLLKPQISLIKILESPCIDVRVAALRFLGNIFEFCFHESEKSDVRLKITKSLLNLLDMKLSPNVIQHFGKILFHIFRDPLPEQIIVGTFFKMHSKRH